MIILQEGQNKLINSCTSKVLNSGNKRVVTNFSPPTVHEFVAECVSFQIIIIEEKLVYVIEQKFAACLFVYYY